MQPAHPNGDTKLGLAEFGSRAEPRASTDRALERNAEPAETPRRLLAQDGLHVRSSRPPRAELTQEESLRERALLALVSSARHELRSPLQSIQGFADLLASESYGALGGDQRAFVEHILQGSADLSRAMDACFELFQAEALHIPTEPLPASLRRLLEEALTIAEANRRGRFEMRLSELDPELAVEIDLHDFSKAIEAVITTLSPLARGRIVVSARAGEGEAELTFAVTEEPRTLRPLHELPRRGVSARALLWLRLAASLLARSDSRLETSESYDKVRILLPT